jgi:hypothetical protein
MWRFLGDSSVYSDSTFQHFSNNYGRPFFKVQDTMFTLTFLMYFVHPFGNQKNRQVRTDQQKEEYRRSTIEILFSKKQITNHSNMCCAFRLHYKVALVRRQWIGHNEMARFHTIPYGARTICTGRRVLLHMGQPVHREEFHLSLLHTRHPLLSTDRKRMTPMNSLYRMAIKCLTPLTRW